MELGGQVLEMMANCGASVGAGGQVLVLVDRCWSWWAGVDAGGQVLELVGRFWCWCG